MSSRPDAEHVATPRSRLGGESAFAVDNTYTNEVWTATPVLIYANCIFRYFVTQLLFLCGGLPIAGSLNSVTLIGCSFANVSSIIGTVELRCSLRFEDCQFDSSSVLPRGPSVTVVNAMTLTGSLPSAVGICPACLATAQGTRKPSVGVLPYARRLPLVRVGMFLLAMVLP